MSAPQVRGVAGLLDGILSPARQEEACTHSDIQPKKKVLTNRTAMGPALPPVTSVRRGRPPGNTARIAPKEKVTVWITSNLIAQYRDWTWEARCHVSHLVERALIAYHKQHRYRAADE